MAHVSVTLRMTGAQTRVTPTKSHSTLMCVFDHGAGCGSRPMELGATHKWY